MNDYSNEFTHFKILPCYRHQNERIKLIKFDDEIFVSPSIDSFMKDSYLSTLKKIEKKDQPQPENVEDFETEDLSQEKEIPIDLTISFEHTTNFQLKLYSSFYQQNHIKLCYGGTFWISHLEKRASLEYFEKDIFEQNNEHKIQKRNTNSHTKKKHTQFQASHTIQIEKHLEILMKRSKILYFEESLDKPMKNTIGIWKIESEDRIKGGYLGGNSKIRLRNLR